MKRQCYYNGHEFDDATGFTHIHRVNNNLTPKVNINAYYCPFHARILGVFGLKVHDPDSESIPDNRDV